MHRLTERPRTAIGELEEMLEVLDRRCARSIQIDHARSERSEPHHLASGARDRDIEPAPAAVPVQRTEVHRHRAGAWLSRSVTDSNQNDVALVALHRLEVLHHDGFDRILAEEALDFGSLLAFDVEQILDQRLLLRV